MPPRRQERHRDEPDSIRKVQQCIGHTKTGARCKRRTSKTPYCFTHLEKEQHLKVKTSQIHGAGFGLYTTVRRPAHRMVAPYTGRSVTRDENDYRGNYVIQLNNNSPFKYVDANHTTDGAGRFANSAVRGDHFTNNSHLSLDRQHHSSKSGSLSSHPSWPRNLANGIRALIRVPHASSPSSYSSG